MTHSFPTRRSSDLKLRSNKPALRRYYVKAIVGRVEVGDHQIRIFGSTRHWNMRLVGLPTIPQHQCPTSNGNGAPKMPKMRPRSEEHTSELQSLMRISYAVFCLKKKNTSNNT